MSRRFRRVLVLSDVHYAGPQEQARGPHFEFAGAPPSVAKTLVQLHRHFLWMRDPLAHNGKLDRCLASVCAPDAVVANGDFARDSNSLGLADDATLESARHCLARLRGAFGERFHATIGDHELGKVSLIGDRGGLRLRSYERAVADCGLRPLWRVNVGRWVLLGVTATVLALPVLMNDVAPAEAAAWAELRAQHLAEVRAAFAAVQAEERVILFCHDPTALPFLWAEPAVRARLPQLEATIIGHLHTRLVFWQSRLLAGVPPVRSLGVSVERMTTALHQARLWRPFKVTLCPSLAGCQLLKDGGFLTVDVEESATQPARLRFHPLPWEG